MKRFALNMAGLAMLGLTAACGSQPAAPSAAAADGDVVSHAFYDHDDLVGNSARHGQDFEFVWLKDNDGDRLNPRQLFADAPDALIDSLGLADGIPSSISTFVLRTQGHTILFDAGLGPKKGGHLGQRLATVGLTPDSIDLVYLTHLHPDHIGGLMTADDAPAFPHAQVYVGQVEYDAWVNDMPADQAGMQRAIMSAYASQLQFFAFGDTLPCGVLAIDAVGHTPGHTVFQAGPYLVIGDLIHGLGLQRSHPTYCANFDMDKPRAIESRRRVLDYAAAHHLIMAGMHLPAPGVAE